MSKKRPAETSTEEPATKKQITQDMIEKLEAENAELKKRDTEAQKMTQDMIEKLQDRTAVVEEKFEKLKKLTDKVKKLAKMQKKLKGTPKMWEKYSNMLRSGKHCELLKEFNTKFLNIEKSIKCNEEQIEILINQF